MGGVRPPFLSILGPTQYRALANSAERRSLEIHRRSSKKTATTISRATSTASIANSGNDTESNYELRAPLRICCVWLTFLHSGLESSANYV